MKINIYNYSLSLNISYDKPHYSNIILTESQNYISQIIIPIIYIYCKMQDNYQSISVKLLKFQIQELY